MIQLGFSLQSQYDLPTDEVVALLADAGFSAVSPVWSPDLGLDALAASVRAHGMTIQSLHAPHKGTPLMWEADSLESFEVQDNILRCIDACARFGVPCMVIHGWQGFFYTFQQESLDFRFFDRMVAHAEAKGVAVAFENLEGEEFLNALLTRYQHLPHVGYCWDSGHDHCYPHKLDFLKAFGDRLIMTHLNDNFGLRDPGGVPTGNDDLHFFPFDGNIDWEHAVRRLKSAKPQGILNFEFKIRSFSTSPADLRYVGLPLSEFLQTAGLRARKIAEMYERIAEDTTASVTRLRQKGDAV